jgi:hypothetical protein
MGEVWVETVQLDSSGGRQIKPTARMNALLNDRRADIESAVREASTIVQDAAATVESKSDWRINRLEAKFALVLTAEAGVILSRASAEAAFEITITIDRK